MIRFPDIKLLNLTSQDLKLLYQASYDIFISMKDSPLFQQLPSNAPIAQAQTFDIQNQTKEDILKYQDEVLTKEEKQKDIISIMTEKTIFDFIGFEIISKNTPMFVNRFVQAQNIRSQLIQMIKTAPNLDQREAYIKSINNISDKDEETLLLFKQNLQRYIDQQHFVETVDNIFGFVGNILKTYFNGRYEVGGHRLPPLVGIEQDMMMLFHNDQLQQKIISTVPGNKMIKVSTNPYIKCCIQMTVRVYNNYMRIKKEDQQYAFLEAQRKKTQEVQQVQEKKPELDQKLWNVND